VVVSEAVVPAWFLLVQRVREHAASVMQCRGNRTAVANAKGLLETHSILFRAWLLLGIGWESVCINDHIKRRGIRA